MQSPGLLPFAALTQTSDPSQVLQQVAQLIDRVPDEQAQSNLTASGAILAGLVLEAEVIQRLLRRDIMQESVIYQAIKAEGREEGQQEITQRIVLNLLQEGMAIEAISRVTGLSVEQIQQLRDTQSPPITE